MPSAEDLDKAREYRQRAEKYRAEAKRYWFRRDRIEELLTGAWVLEQLAQQLDGGATRDESDPDAIFRQG